MNLKIKNIFILTSFVIFSLNSSIVSMNWDNWKNSTIPNRIETILNSNNNSNLNIGVEIYSLKRKKVIYSHNEDHKFTPASNTKIFTSLSAFDTLGSDYQFETQLFTDGIVQDNAIEGNVYLKGSGDPSLISQDIEKLIKHLSDQGIRIITGDFCIDKTEFDQECFAPGTTIDDLGESFYNPVNSLIIDHKAAGLHPMNIVCFTDNKKLENLFFDLARFLEDVLEKNNIKLVGGLNFKQAQPEFTVISNHKSEKLSVLLTHLNKESDNLYADCLFKKLGFINSKQLGSWQTGAQALKYFLQTKLGINLEEIKIVDGAGLSRYNLVSPHQIVTALTWAYEQPFFDSFLKSLSIAGVDGCLKNRMLKLSSKVKAKTGTLGGCSSLSGYIKTDDQDMLVFSILINGYISNSLYNPPCNSEIQDAICKLLIN